MNCPYFKRLVCNVWRFTLIFCVSTDSKTDLISLLNKHFMNFTLKTIAVAVAMVGLFGCKKEPDKMLHFVIKFDSLQEKLGNNGLPATLRTENAAQTPALNSIGFNGIELVQNEFTKYGQGVSVFSTPETTLGGEKALDYQQVKSVKAGETIFSIPLKDIAPGTYNWIRTSVAYQNFDVIFNMLNVPFAGNFLEERGTMASFMASNTYITPNKIWEKMDTTKGNRKQGFWAFETKLTPAYNPYNRMFNGQSALGATTSPNPLLQTSPTPLENTVLTGRFEGSLSISGSETADVTVTLTFSNNKSFEWEETINRNGKWDFNMQPVPGQPSVERIIDVGLRSLKASVNK
jgi:hypothetical protein